MFSSLRKKSKQTEERETNFERAFGVSITPQNMSETTPDRTARSSSRVGTPRARPRSRRNSRTPVRTPSRRRATIVSASLITPRRNRRPSTTPQNTLRILSRALVRQNQTDGATEGEHEHEHNHEQVNQIEEQEYYSEGDIGEDLYKVPLPAGQQFYQQLQSDEEELLAPSDIAFPVAMMLSDTMDNDYAPKEYVTPGEYYTPHDDQHLAQDENENEEDHISSMIEDVRDTYQTKSPLRTPVKTVKSTSNKPKREIKALHLPTTSLRKFARSTISKSLNEQSYAMVADTTDLFFEQLSDDLVAYCEHSKSKSTIDLKSVMLLLKRQRVVDSVDSLLNVIEESLPLEQVLEIRRNISKIL